MGYAAADPRAMRLDSPSGLSVQVNANGSIRRMSFGEIDITLFVGSGMEGGPANLWLRQIERRSGVRQCAPLLGPRSATRFSQHSETTLLGVGQCGELRYSVALVLSQRAPAWFWHVSVENSTEAQEFDLIYTQDLALAPYAALRMNEYYVSQYVDHTPLMDQEHGWLVASRQNLAVNRRFPWSAIGSMRRGASFATDAMQVHGLASRCGSTPTGLADGLPGRRLQHEHSMVAIQDAPARLERGARAICGFFGLLRADHPAATSNADLAIVDQAGALPEAKPIVVDPRFEAPAPSRSLFSTAPLLDAMDLSESEIAALFGARRRHEERDERGMLLSFFCGECSHVVLRTKEMRVQRPHGHLLRTGRELTPDESALTSTTWMSGVFHSMLTQGHVSINRFLSTVRSYLGLFRSHGQRVFAELDGAWRLLDMPSGFQMTPDGCRWIYRHAGGVIEVRTEAHSNPHELTLDIVVRDGQPVRFLVSHHVALNGDDGSTDGCASWRSEGAGVAVFPAQSSDLQRRFPDGSFLISPANGAEFERIGGDELLFPDGRSRQQPYICVATAPARSAGLHIRGRLLPAATVPEAGSIGNASLPELQCTPAAHDEYANRVAQLNEIAPWFVHNALVHYLSPRGLEQYTGGGWGVRDVCQGPVELLLAHGRTTPVRDLLLRVMRAQNPDGDWPQWFMFFERDRDIRAGDSHGDIVFWPVLALAQYLIASGDAGVLDEVEAFHSAKDAVSAGATVWDHVQRALAVIDKRVVQGTALAAYGHGDWNDSLQPVDTAMREHVCSAWTVTLHRQTLVTLARALRIIGRDGAAARLEKQAAAIQSDFRRFLLVDGVLAGYALFEGDEIRYLLHPRDGTSGVHYSALAMIHAILEGMLTPAQARSHLSLIDEHLSGPDGVRLFDRPLPYHGGPQRMFQRAESAAFFGREIGLMYMHAHLRYAQALAHVGEAERFFHALCQANPIGMQSLVSSASPRQSNCYYSSSDAAFADRYEAGAEYDRVRRGEVVLDGGWRVYSSGAGIAMSLIIRCFLGLNQEHDALVLDPVIPAALTGLRVQLSLYDRPIEVTYQTSGAGCGVTAIEINGVQPTFDYDDNPYRKGGARVSKAVCVALLRERNNVVNVCLG